ncbi:hypothetical protein [Gordonia sp. KTR9]|uniref:hypothetical protein n=1 Tax=Gordonia sp. KTR9 TaxID=337191 RepID=UPI0005CACFDF|nr:hypothetical protein [Gordonia sp. KTR9]
MRPTIEEELAGATRLLRLAETCEQPGAGELARDARRLIGWVSASWHQALPFLVEDNQRLTSLLKVPPATAVADLDDAIAVNDQLREQLCEGIRNNAVGLDRVEVLQYLRARIAADPS